MNDILRHEKIKALDRLLFDDHVLVHMDGRYAGAVLPPHLKENPSVTLKLSRNFRGGIALEKTEIITNLLFSGTYVECKIPYEAIWGATSDKGKNTLWPESIPSDIVMQLVAGQVKQSQAEASAEQSQAAAPAPAEKPKATKAAPKKSKSKGGHLRRVK